MEPHPDNNLVIRRMTRAEVDLAIDWAAAEGWNPGLEDAECFYNADPDGFFIAILNGVAAGCISAVRYGPGFGFIGLFLVKPEYRGGRLGIRLGQVAMAHLAGRNIGLDGVLNKAANYETWGFKFAWKNIRFAGSGGGSPNGSAERLDKFDYRDVAEYDARMFGAERSAFLPGWLKQQNALAVGARVSGRLAGYGVIRKCRSGWKIGPLFADNAGIAADLAGALAARAGGETWYLDVPEPNAEALEIVRARGMKEVFATARMYSRSTPRLPTANIFGVTTFELG